MESFFSLLERRVEDCSSLLCVGLDPHPEDLPSPGAEGARALCDRLIQTTARYAAAFKANAAFFEAMGPEGWKLLGEVVTAIQAESHRQGSHIPVILDAKRGDIASTAEAYARSAFDMLGADAITLSPYLGADAIEPFLRDGEKGVFLLCRTSNPGAADLQDLPIVASVHPEPLYIAVGRLARRLNTRGNVGLVVGATDPDALARIRNAVPDLWILCPGVGAQGGDLRAALHAGLRTDGRGVLLAVSRSLSRAPDPARLAAELRDQMVELRSARRPWPGGDIPPAPAGAALLADALLEAGCVCFGEFTLKSGIRSPIYFDLRRLVSHPRLLALVADAYLPVLQALRFDRLAALPYGALPIAAAVSLRASYPWIYPRKGAKAYGTRAEIEGEFNPGEAVVIIDDLATTGGSKLEALERLSAAGLRVSDAVVLIDRQGGAERALAAAGVRLHAVLNLAQMLEDWEARGRVPAEQIRAVRAFLARQGRQTAQPPSPESEG